MKKPTDSQQVKSEKTNRISQQLENDTTLSFPDSLVSFEITTKVIQSGDHIADEDADDENQGQVVCDIQDSIVVGRT